MLDFANLLEFSHHHCIAICGAMVPITSLGTIQTIIFAGLNRSLTQIWWSAALTSCGVLLLLLHVLSWFVVGVVAMQTYLLLFLGSLYLSVNVLVSLYPQSTRGILLALGRAMIGNRMVVRLR